ncbi:MAG: hypothetical protein JWO13_459 [Acidobacteriales bacterium]|nr:hypothetical protein [Terriglobales bacterium]
MLVLRAGNWHMVREVALRIGIVGLGVVGSALLKYFKISEQNAVYGYDKHLAEYCSEEQREQVNACDLVFVAVPTPSAPHGSDLTEIKKCLKWISAPVCIKSTVTPGAIDELESLEGLSFSPEFIGESAAHPWKDIDSCGYVIVGGNRRICDLVICAYMTVNPDIPIFVTDSRTAELVKYMDNCYLMTKVLFVNQFNLIAEAIGIDFEEVRRLWLLDPRVGDSHTIVTPEKGVGGKCLPKDMAALTAEMRSGASVQFLEALIEFNKMIQSHFSARNSR